jgi:hypothetical protein
VDSKRVCWGQYFEFGLANCASGSKPQHKRYKNHPKDPKVVKGCKRLYRLRKKYY